MKSEDAPEASSETAQTDEVTPFAREILYCTTAKPLGNPATQRQEAKARKRHARPPARYGVFIGKDTERYLTQSRVLGNRTLRRLRLYAQSRYLDSAEAKLVRLPRI